MERNWDLSEMTDGKLYTENDLARIGCNDCEGCSKCCHNMGESIVLDPYDIYQFAKAGITMEELMSRAVELNVADGVILPNLKMQEDGGKCYFLDENGRCSVHSNRPGICRLFPLGRIYDDNDFKYFNQIYECPKKNKTKVRIDKWLGIDNINKYHEYIVIWHYFLKDIQHILEGMQDEKQIKTTTMYLVKLFYLMPYEVNDDFYTQFTQRINKVKEVIG